ncbi:MAG: permease [Actinobacteria bacterium]|nr:permease [Actinomycetota bacterium]
MELLATNQPWNLLIFMATPVVLAEILAVTELALLFRSNNPAWVRTLSRTAGLIAGPVMVGILLHLLRFAVVPLTSGGGWRGIADVIAVGFYLVGAFPMIGITLVELGLIGRDPADVRKLHATFVGAFLVVAHIAMIFGMLDPTLLWNPTHAMPGAAPMSGMNHLAPASSTPR